MESTIERRVLYYFHLMVEQMVVGKAEDVILATAMDYYSENGQVERWGRKWSFFCDFFSECHGYIFSKDVSYWSVLHRNKHGYVCGFCMTECLFSSMNLTIMLLFSTHHQFSRFTLGFFFSLSS